MMLMAMRPHKTQMSSLFKYTASGSFTSRDLALMFGYTKFDALAVGGCGGRAGGFIYMGAVYYRPPAGGGGGSSKIVSGNLVDLPSTVPVTVGGVGATGADGTHPNPSGAGGRGGNSSFGTVVTGYGGYGGKSASYGVLPVGGEGANPDGSPGPAGAYISGSAYVAPVAGTWNDALKQGSGGGGGGATLNDVGADSTPGAGGNSGGSYFAGGEADSAVPGSNQGSWYGGGGGGCNIGPFIGVASEDYGSGWKSSKGNGVVAVKLS